MDDSRLAPRLRDRAVDRLNGLTTGAAALGLIATAGFGTVAAMTTHVPGVSGSDVSGADSVSPDDGSDDPVGGAITPESQASGPAVSGVSRAGNVAAPKVRAVSPAHRAPRHASTGGS